MFLIQQVSEKQTLFKARIIQWKIERKKHGGRHGIQGCLKKRYGNSTGFPAS
jgi:hypothetical protein